MRDPKDKSPLRVLDVIQSCETQDQLKGAETYTRLWIRNGNGVRNHADGLMLVMAFGNALAERARAIEAKGQVVQ